jgi:hypothetical protein
MRNCRPVLETTNPSGHKIRETRRPRSLHTPPSARILPSSAHATNPTVFNLDEILIPQRPNLEFELRVDSFIIIQRVLGLGLVQQKHPQGQHAQTGHDLDGSDLPILLAVGFNHVARHFANDLRHFVSPLGFVSHGVALDVHVLLAYVPEEFGQV